MLEKDDKTTESLGTIGTFSDRMITEALFWRLVCNLRLSPKEIDTWTIGQMRMADAYMNMQNDYKRALGVDLDEPDDDTLQTE